MTEEQVFQRFLDAVKAAGGQRAFARHVGFTVSYINDIMHKRRDVSERILRELGIEKIVTTTVEYRNIIPPQQDAKE